MQAADRNLTVQALRFIAAALVLVAHISFYLHERVDRTIDVLNVGEPGVSLFFIISGYVMFISGGKLINVGNGALVFILRRIARVMPMYWFVTTAKIAIALSVPAVVLHNTPDLYKAICSYFLIPAFNDEGSIRPIHGVGWTLLHEMFFYYLFAISLFLKKSPIVFCSVIIVLLFILGKVFEPTSAVAIITTSEINLFFVIGMFIAFFFEKTRTIGLAFSVPIFLLGVASLTLHLTDWIQPRTGGVFDMGAVLVFVSLVLINPVGRFSCLGFLSRLGDSSYSLYLIHPILAPAACVGLTKIGIHNPIVIGISALIICIVGGIFCYRVIELPLSGFAKSGFNRLACVQS